MSRSAIASFVTVSSDVLTVPRTLTVPDRCKVFNVPLGRNVKLTHLHHEYSPHSLRSLRKLFESLFRDEATSGVDENYMIITAAAVVGHRVSLMARACPPERQEVLVLPMALAVVFDEVYNPNVLAELQMYERNAHPLWSLQSGERRRTIEETVRNQANAALYFRDALAETSRSVQEFIRGSRRTTTTVTFKGDISRINEIDILAAVLPRFAFSIMNVLLELISFSCVDAHQEPGFVEHSSTKHSVDAPVKSSLFFKGSPSLITQGVSGGSNTIIGHACLLFVILTQLDDDEYMRYCSRMGLPDTENVRGRRPVFQLVTSKRIHPSRSALLPTPIRASPAVPIGLNGKPITNAPGTPIIPRSDASPSPLPYPPAAPKTSREFRNNRYWRLRSESNINELDLLMKATETRGGSARHRTNNELVDSVSSSSSSSASPSIVKTPLMSLPSYWEHVGNWISRAYPSKENKKTETDARPGEKRPRSAIVVDDEPETKAHRPSFDDDETQPTGQTDSQFVRDFVTRSIDAVADKNKQEDIDDEPDTDDLTPIDPDVAPSPSASTGGSTLAD